MRNSILLIFGDSNITGKWAVAYAVVFQPNGTQQNFIASKSHLAKQKLSIPRLELEAAHMAANLADNIKTAITNLNIRNVFGWSDSIVVLQWLQKNGNYIQFVNSKVMYQQTKNPGDIGSRGVYGNLIHSLLWNRLTWLQNRDQWPTEAIIKANEEMEKEVEKIKTVSAAKIKQTSLTSCEKNTVCGNSFVLHHGY